jgi:hypothetical protein
LGRPRQARPAEQLLQRGFYQRVRPFRVRQNNLPSQRQRKVSDLHVKRNAGYATVTPVFLFTLTCDRHMSPVAAR